MIIKNRFKKFLQLMYKKEPQNFLRKREIAENVWTPEHFTTLPRNLQGMNVFIYPVSKVTFRYASHGGGSEGAREYLRKKLVPLAKAFPSVAFEVEASIRICNPVLFVEYSKVSRRTVHSSLILCVANGRSMNFPLRRLSEEAVENQVREAMSQQGRLRQKFHEKAHSLMPAIRPLWSAFHQPPLKHEQLFKRPYLRG